jgi:Holliday junction resolvase RusA-like endonuclease
MPSMKSQHYFQKNKLDVFSVTVKIVASQKMHIISIRVKLFFVIHWFFKLSDEKCSNFLISSL